MRFIHAVLFALLFLTAACAARGQDGASSSRSGIYMGGAAGSGF